MNVHGRTHQVQHTDHQAQYPGFEPCFLGIRCLLSFCFVLFCFVLFCFVLFCFVLFCFVLFCFVLFCFVLFCFVLFCFVLFCFVSINVNTACFCRWMPFHIPVGKILPTSEGQLVKSSYIFQVTSLPLPRHFFLHYFSFCPPARFPSYISPFHLF